MQQNQTGRVLLCVALSVLLHVGLGLLLLLVPPPEQPVKPKKQARKARVVQVVRTPERKRADAHKRQAPKPATPQEKPESQKPTGPKPFAKTSADTPQRRPQQPEYEGQRDTRAASAPDDAHRRSDAPAPAQHGEEKEELVTFDQERQDGPLEHEGLRREKQQTPATPLPPAPPAPPLPPAEPAATGRPDATAATTPPGTDATNTRPDTTRALTMAATAGDGLNLQPELPEIPIAELEQQAAQPGTPEGQGKARHPQPGRPAAARPRVFFDPSLADSRQAPGFRTYERRSRSSGRFVLGRGAALNVAATPRGQYEALVYRRIAHHWYIACDEHRGDIIPGKITISLRITRRGQIDSMALIRRSGASISQQSFTFKAIRRASLPPMPPEVQAGVIGKLMELIFEFNFD